MNDAEPEKWMPHKGPQTVFHSLNVYEAFFGGAKGPGKTETILREGIRQVNNPKYRACIFRRTFPQLGECIDRTFKYFKRLGAAYSDKDIQLKLPAWTFPSGAKYAFSHLQHEKDKYNHQGKEWHYLGFDQLEQFTETQYLYIIAQNRSSDPAMRCYIRSSGNPGGVGHGWVKRRFIDPFKDCPVGTIKYFYRDEHDEDIEVDKNHPDAISRCFIPSTLKDNPSLLVNDPTYLKRLKLLCFSDQKAFIGGDWESFSGQFFTMWRHSRHVKVRPIVKNFRKLLSLDYGYACPSSVGWWQVEPDGHMHRYREVYKEGLTYERLAHMILEMTPPDEVIDYCVADPSIWGDTSRHREEIKGETGAEIMSSVFGRFTTIVKGDNNRIPGWGKMRIYLENEQVSCNPSCKASIRTIPDLVHDEHKVEDVDTTGEDHPGDDWRYALNSRPEPMPKAPPPIVKNTEEYFEERERRQAIRRGELEDVEDLQEIS